MDGWVNRLTDRQIDRHPDKQTDRQTDLKTFRFVETKNKLLFRQTSTN
jgi:hypothetical protein